jgi:hypothetical protein
MRKQVSEADLLSHRSAVKVCREEGESIRDIGGEENEAGDLIDAFESECSAFNVEWDAYVHGEREKVRRAHENGRKGGLAKAREMARIEKSEKQVTIEIRMMLAEEGVTNWRNHQINTGRGRAGLAIGGSDIVAVVAPHGRLLAIEIKAPGKRTHKFREEQQDRFLRLVRESGGVSGYARSKEEARALLEEAREKAV